MRADEPGCGDDADCQQAGAAERHTGTGVPASASATTSSGVDTRGARLGREDQAMREDGDGERLDVLRKHEVAALHEGARLGERQQRDAGARAAAEREPRRSRACDEGARRRSA